MSVRRTAEVLTLFLAGTDFIKSFEIAADAKESRYAVQPGSAQAPWNMDPSLEIKDSGTFTGLFFQGITNYLGSSIR